MRPFACLTAVFCLLSVQAFAAEDAFLGLWSRGDGKALVRIEKCGSALCAVNTWIRPDVADERVGDRLVLKVAADGPSAMTGEAFDPQRNATFRFSMEAGARTMTTHGCMLAGLLCKSMHWSRSAAAD